METYIVVIIIVLVLAVLFFGASVISGEGSSTTGKAVNNYPTTQYAGGACGR